MQCASMDARIYRGGRSSVFRGDRKRWRLRVEERPARRLHGRSVARETWGVEGSGARGRVRQSGGELPIQITLAPCDGKREFAPTTAAAVHFSLVMKTFTVVLF